jgi:leucyl/phenylalanyl-tRNA---protein transferase
MEGLVIPVDQLLRAYRHGWFPMGERGTSRIEWFSPDPRGILPLGNVHIPAHLRRVVRQRKFDVRWDTAFGAVIRACAERDETWISAPIIDSYVTLHRHGFAHSVEAWQNDVLVGGLYGVSLGGAFFGESMFHTVTNASKVALCALVERLESRQFALLDIQWVTPHLRQFGAIEIARSRYVQLVTASVDLDRRFS